MAWIPCSGRETIDDVVWVKRMAQKARRAKESRDSGADLMNGYLYGENDFVDGKVLRFLELTDAQFSDAVCSEPDDEAGARRAFGLSARSSEERREFSDKLRKSMGDFFLLDADENRTRPGFKTSATKFFYNSLMMPIVYVIFSRAERKRATSATEHSNER